MKWTFYTATGLFLMIMLSSFAARMEATCPEIVMERGLESRGDQPGSMKNVSYRISGTLKGRDGSCLVIRLELLSIRIQAKKANMILDIYLYNILLGKEKTITKRVELRM